MNKLRRASLAGKSSEQPGRAFILRALNICVLILTARDSARKPRALRKTARAGLYIFQSVSDSVKHTFTLSHQLCSLYT